MPSPEELTRPCPRCKVAASQKCLGRKGQTLSWFHESRKAKDSGTGATALAPVPVPSPEEFPDEPKPRGKLLTCTFCVISTTKGVRHDLCPRVITWGKNVWKCPCTAAHPQDQEETNQ
jgi:hypothetical protein